MEDIFDDISFDKDESRIRVLVIYDIIENKRRLKLMRFLQGFGYRVQKSAFEAFLKENVYQKMLDGLKRYVSEEDSIRIYRLNRNCSVTVYGISEETLPMETIII